jgi:hypothetical protein
MAEPAFVLLDFDNLASNNVSGNLTQWLATLVSYLRSQYHVVKIAAYADWLKLVSHQKQLDGLGVDTINVSSNTRLGKNSADIELVVDAMEYVS